MSVDDHGAEEDVRRGRAGNDKDEDQAVGYEWIRGEHPRVMSDRGSRPVNIAVVGARKSRAGVLRIHDM